MYARMDVPRVSLRRLYAATSALTAEHASEDELLDRIVRGAALLTRSPYAAVGLIDENGALSRFVTTGLAPDEYARLKDHPPTGRGVLGALLHEGRPLRLDDIGTDPRSVGFPEGHPVMRAFLGLPLHLDGAVIGRLYVATSTSGSYDAQDEHLAMGYAAAASVAIGNARLAAKLNERTASANLTAGQLRAILDAMERGVSMTNHDGAIVIANERLSELLGLTGSPVGLSEVELATRFRTPETLLSVLGLERNQPRLTLIDELRLADSDRILSRHGTAVVASDGELLGRLAVYSDVSQQREVQDQLVAVERLRATGEMASGLAHDFNNLLATILGRVEVMLGQQPDAALADNLLAIQRAARDGAATVGRLREYGRPLDAIGFRPVSLGEIARQAIELTQPRWRDQAQREGRTIAIGLRIEPTLPVLGDPSSLRDVLVNLIFNAVDAMPNGGTLSIQLAPAGAGAELTVRDTGVGMPLALQRRAFEPFFTTKGDKGSGLGLAMARKVVTSIGGRIDVASLPGEGTTFTLWFPTTDAPDAVEPESVDGAMPSRSARIVLVDDQLDVLDTAAMLLRADGHDPRAFTDPRAAIASIGDDPPDLVISDLGMPGMSGWELARIIHRRHPALPVVFLTGWGREISAAQMREGSVSAVIPKPIDGGALRRAVAAALPKVDRPLRILLIDDSAAFAAVLALLLRQAGHDVRHVETGGAAIEIISAEQFDLLLLDSGLPDRPASDVLAAAAGLTARPTTCVVSGSAVADMMSATPGADLYVEKVRVPDRLDEIVHHARVSARA
ncbi:MAG: response regulator [Chloroflexota bacterium]|nr:MAG: response regulator [Chloroflexota bacterium]